MPVSADELRRAAEWCFVIFMVGAYFFLLWLLVDWSYRHRGWLGRLIKRVGTHFMRGEG